MGRYVEKIKEVKRNSKMNQSKPQHPPSIITRVFNYATAYKEWVQAGKPIRLQVEIDYIFKTFCEPCEHFSGSICNLCGCYVNKTDGWNKLLWSTTKCPLDEPKWGTSENSRPEDEKQALEHLSPAPEPDPPIPPPAPKANPCGCR